MTKKIALVLATVLLSGCTTLECGWRAFDRGNYSSAEEIAALNMAKDPMNADVYRLTAQTQLARGNADAATKAAEFAVSLDPTSVKGARILRNTYKSNGDWASYCNEVARSRKAGAWADLKADDTTSIQTATSELLKTGAPEAWPCYEALKDMGESTDTLPELTASRRAYADKLAKKGFLKDAIDLMDTSEFEDDNKLTAAEYEYFRLERQNAATRLRTYVAQAPNDETRCLKAAQVAQNANDWFLADEILAGAPTPNTLLPRAYAKLHTGHADEAQALLNQWFADDHAEADIQNTTQTLIRMGFVEQAAIAAEQWKTGTTQARFNLADTFDQSFASNHAKAIVEQAAELAQDDPQTCAKAANWYQRHQAVPEAVRWSEKAMSLGYDNADFTLNLCRLYAQNRDFMALQRQSDAYIASNSDKVRAQCEIAQIYADNSDFDRALKLLEPGASQDQLNASCDALYINSLLSTSQLEKLYQHLLPRTQKGELSNTALARQFSNNPAANAQFTAALEPVLVSGSQTEKIEALRMTAEYAHDQLENESRADEALTQLAELSPTSVIFAEIVNFYKTRSAYDKAKRYAQMWIERFPNDAAAQRALGRIELSQNQFSAATQAYRQFFMLSSDKVSAFRTTSEELSANHPAEGFDATQRLYDEYCQSNTADPVMTGMFGEIALNEAKRAKNLDPVRARTLDELGEQMLEKAINTSQDANLRIQLGNSLVTRHHKHTLATKAFAQANQDKAYNDTARLNHLQACLQAPDSPCSDKQMSNILAGFSEKANWIAIIDVLHNAQRMDLAQPHYQVALASNDFKARSEALNELVDLALEQEDIKSIDTYLDTFEKAAPNNASAHTQLAQIQLKLGRWDEVVKQLTWLQAVRPDARENLDLAFKLSRRAPDNPNAQALYQNFVRSADGVSHRLQWLGEIHQTYGLKTEAIQDYKRAEAASPVELPETQLKILLLAIEMSDEQTTQDYLNKLELSSLWNHTTLQKIADAYVNNGNILEAQKYMRTAQQMAPESTSHKSIKLNMALNSQKAGLIMTTIDEAMQPTAIDVIQPLIEHGAYLDAIETVDKYAEAHDFASATYALMKLKPQYTLVRGPNDYDQKLAAYAKTAAISLDAPKSFVPDQTTPEALINQALANGDAPEALRRFATSTLNARATADATARLAAAGFAREALDIAIPRLESLTKDKTQNPQACAKLAIVVKALAPEQTRFDEVAKHLADDELAFIPAETLAKTGLFLPKSATWLDEHTPIAYDALLNTAMIYAKNHANEADAIHAFVGDAIQHHDTRAALWLSYSRHAVENGFLNEALSAIDHAAAIEPDSAYVQHRRAAILDQMARYDDAVKALEKGESLTPNATTYWQDALTATPNAAARFKNAVVEHQRAIAPNAITTLMNELDAKLTAESFDEAAEIAQKLYDNSDMARVQNIVERFNQAKHVEKLPACYTQDDNAATWLIKAYQAVQDQHIDQAAVNFHEAAKRSLWPNDVYQKAFEIIATQGSKEDLDQIARLAETNMTRSPAPALLKAVVFASKNDEQGTKSAMAQAISLSRAPEDTLARALFYANTPQEAQLLIKAVDQFSPKQAAIALNAELKNHDLSTLNAKKANDLLNIMDSLAKTTFIPVTHQDKLAELCQIAGQTERQKQLTNAADALKLIGETHD